MTICQVCEIEAIHSKLAYQTIAYFCRRIDWRGRIGEDGKGNHRISGIQSIPSKIGLIDSSSFVLEKRLAWAEIGGEERNMGLAAHRFLFVWESIAIQTFKLPILISKPQFLISKSQF